MQEQNISLTPTEWHLMECLWESAPRTGREASDYLRAHVGWTRSTTLTLLRRMTDKGFISCSETGGVKVYAPLIRREDAVMRETDDLLQRVFKGSVSMMMSAVTKKQELTRDEIDALYEILRRAEEGRK
jgi:BlaI family penicillinase repressor